MAMIAKTVVELMEELIQQMERKHKIERKHEKCNMCKMPLELVEEVIRHMERKHENCNRCKMPPGLVERLLVLMRKELETQELPIEPPQGEVKVPIEKQPGVSGDSPTSIGD